MTPGEKQVRALCFSYRSKRAPADKRLDMPSAPVRLLAAGASSLHLKLRQSQYRAGMLPAFT